jgi:hypothetical protein
LLTITTVYMALAIDVAIVFHTRAIIGSVHMRQLTAIIALPLLLVLLRARAGTGGRAGSTRVAIISPPVEYHDDALLLVSAHSPTSLTVRTCCAIERLQPMDRSRSIAVDWLRGTVLRTDESDDVRLTHPVQAKSTRS